MGPKGQKKKKGQREFQGGVEKSPAPRTKMNQDRWKAEKKKNSRKEKMSETAS